MTLDKVLSNIVNVIINPLVILLFAVALLIFIWGCIQYIRNGDDPTKRADGVRNFTYGIIGMAIMISAFGIAKFVQGLIPDSSGSNVLQGYVPPNIDSLRQ